MNDHAWLRGGETSMLCDWRFGFGDNPSSVSVTGCQNYKLDRIVKHAANRLLVKSEWIHKSGSKLICEASEIKFKIKTWVTSNFRLVTRVLKVVVPVAKWHFRIGRKTLLIIKWNHQGTIS